MLSAFFLHVSIPHTNSKQILNIIINQYRITLYPNNINACARYNAKLMQGDVAGRFQPVIFTLMKIDGLNIMAGDTETADILDKRSLKNRKEICYNSN